VGLNPPLNFFIFPPNKSWTRDHRIPTINLSNVGKEKPMAHNVQTMFYTGERPWHGLGVELFSPANSEEALHAAELDWEVDKVPMVSAVKKPDGSTLYLPSKLFSLRRRDTGIILVEGVTDRYTIAQNRRVFEIADLMVGEKGEFAMYHTAGALGQGEIVWMLIKLPEVIRVDGRPKDIIEKFLLITIQHGGGANHVLFTNVRVVCQNTYNVAIKGVREKYAFNHTPQIEERMLQVKEVLGIQRNYYSQYANMVNAMNKVKMNKALVEGFFTKITATEGEKRGRLPSEKVTNIRNHMLANFEDKDMGNFGETLWDAVNAVSQYTDHNQIIKKLDEFPDNRLRSIWFGHGSTLKQKAHDAATELLV